jgi:hypothetical protein
MRRPQRVAECGSPPKFHIEQPLAVNAQKILRLRRSRSTFRKAQCQIPSNVRFHVYLMASTGSLRYEG